MKYLNKNFYVEKVKVENLIKKFKTPLVPIFIERIDNVRFKITINKPILFNNNCTIQKITDDFIKSIIIFDNSSDFFSIIIRFFE